MIFVKLSKYRHLFCNFAPDWTYMKYQMRKFLILIVSALMPVLACAQAQINTKKMKIADFPQKVTKVVLPGNSFYDTAFQEDVADRWRVSPYELCTLDEFESLKGNDQYYFLILTQGQFKKEQEPGLQFLTLVKGGAEAAEGLDAMLEIATVPFAAADDPSGREITYLPALLDIIQNYALASIEKDFSNLGGLSNFATNVSKAADMNIVFADEDLSTEITEDAKETMFDSKIEVMDVDTADEVAAEGLQNTLVSYVIAPADPISGSFCYKLLIDANNHELFYFRKHKIGKKAGSGFLLEDIKRITSPRPKKK